MQDTIFMNESALFNLTVNNTQGVLDSFRFNYDDIRWSLYTDPQSDYFGGMKVPANSARTTTLLLTPRTGVTGGKYAIKLTLISENTGMELSKYLEIHARSLLVPIPDYDPNIALTFELGNGGKFDPRNSGTIRLYIKNKNALSFPNVDVSLKSNLITKERTISLEPLERRTEDFSFSFKSNTIPQKDTLLITVTAGNGTFHTLAEYEIIPYRVPFEQQIILHKAFLKPTHEIKVVNPSNTEKREVVLFKSPFFKTMFSSSNPPGKAMKVSGKRYIGWDIELSAQETRNYFVTYNYRPLVITLCIVAIVVFFYFILRSPLEVKKRVSNIYTREGGISRLRVQIVIKNRSPDPVHEVKIFDSIPTIAEVLRDFQLGSIQPTKVTERENKSTLIMWHLFALEPNEERLISYDIKSRLSILGELDLGATGVKFKDKRGNDKKTSSNVLLVNMRAKAQPL
jgi:hypothetical protein